MSVFIPSAQDSEQTDRLDGTNRVLSGCVEVDDNGGQFPLIRLGVSEDSGEEDWGYIREYAALTPAEARKIARALNRAAKVADEHIKAHGMTKDDLRELAA